MTRRSRQPVATSLRVGERPAAMRRRRRRRRRRRKRASWGCCDYFIGCISERESARKNCMLQCVAREAEGGGGREAVIVAASLQLQQDGVSWSPHAAAAAAASCISLLTVCNISPFPIAPHRIASRRVALLIATSAMIMWH